MFFDFFFIDGYGSVLSLTLLRNGCWCLVFRVWSLKIDDGCTWSIQKCYVSGHSLIDTDIDSWWIEQHAVKKALKKWKSFEKYAISSTFKRFN